MFAFLVGSVTPGILFRSGRRFRRQGRGGGCSKPLLQRPVSVVKTLQSGIPRVEKLSMRKLMPVYRVGFGQSLTHLVVAHVLTGTFQHLVYKIILYYVGFNGFEPVLPQFGADFLPGARDRRPLPIQSLVYVVSHQPPFASVSHHKRMPLSWTSTQ